MEAEFIRYYESHRSLEQVVPEAVEALVAGKRAGITTALVTSKNREELANTLPRLGIVPYVDLIVSADDVIRPKPDPEGILFALKSLKLDPSRTVFVGDTVHDMRAAKAAEVRRCAVTWGAGPRSALEAETPDYICDQPSDLRSILSIA
jgi:HAD superfamily hydrolase (TIGR01509 family)